MSGLVGITGTREDPTPLQAATLGWYLHQLRRLDGMTELVHGDATGVDALAHDLGMIMAYTVHVRPPDIPTYRAFKTGHHNYKPAPYMTRNRTIAAHCTRLVAGPAVPEGDPQSARSGTWATVRMARRLGKPITLIWPDGRIETEGARDDTQSDGDGGRDQPAGREGLGPGAVVETGGRGRQ